MRAAQVVAAVVTIVLILTLGFQAALFLLLFLVLSYALAAVAVLITVRSSMRLEDSPTMAPIPLGDPSIPDVARAALDTNHAALVALGFAPRDMVFLPQRTTPGGYLALYVHRGIPASAFSRVLLKPGRGRPAVLSSEVEFEVTYDNGTIAELSNVVNPALAIDRVAGIAIQMPHVTDVAQLFQYFRKLVAKYERDTGLTERSRIPLPDDKTAASLFEYQLARGHAIQHAAGLLYASDKPGVWRPTWPTSFRIAGSAISPFREMIHRRLRENGERIRRELDALN
jgi:hypothetical protein